MKIIHIQSINTRSNIFDENQAYQGQYDEGHWGQTICHWEENRDWLEHQMWKELQKSIIILSVGLPILIK